MSFLAKSFALVIESYSCFSERARRGGLGSELIAEAERRARRRGSQLLHLSTYSFQAPEFYEKLSFRRVGKMSGSPKGASRYYYLKRL